MKTSNYVMKNIWTKVQLWVQILNTQSCDERWVNENIKIIHSDCYKKRSLSQKSLYIIVKPNYQLIKLLKMTDPFQNPAGWT